MASPVPARSLGRTRDTAEMGDVVYMVRAASEAACQRELDRLCQRLDAIPVTAPTDTAGHRWIARAVPAPTAKAPTGDGQGPAMSD